MALESLAQALLLKPKRRSRLLKQIRLMIASMCMKHAHEMKKRYPNIAYGQLLSLAYIRDRNMIERTSYLVRKHDSKELHHAYEAEIKLK